MARRSSRTGCIRRSLVALTTIALIGAGCGQASAPSPSVPSAAPTATPVPSPMPTASPPATAPPTLAPATPRPSPSPGARWERVADQGAFADGLMEAVVAGPDRYVAVGRTIRADGDDLVIEGAIWTSADGLAWHRTSVASSEEASVAGIVHDRIGYVAWGHSTPEAAAAFWVSPDGESWSRAPDGPTLRGVAVTGVARLGDDLVAVGFAEVEAEDRVLYEFRTWTSPDGLAWQAVVPSTQPSWQGSVEGVLSTDGALVAWGWDWSGETSRAVSLRSTDGRRWEVRVSAPTDGFIGDISATGGRLVAVGSGPGEEGAGGPPPPSAAWTSTDGQAWIAAAFQPPMPIGTLLRVAWDGRSYLAIGSAEVAVTAWRSADGTSWTQEASVPDAERDGADVGCTGGVCPNTWVSDLAAGPAGLIAVGSTRSLTGHSRAVVWIAPADGGQVEGTGSPQGLDSTRPRCFPSGPCAPGERWPERCA